MVICLERGADLHMAQLMPLPLTLSCFRKIQIGFIFLVPAHLGSPGKRAVKWACVCVCLCQPSCGLHYIFTLSSVCLQCFDAVEGHPACRKLSGGLLPWLSVWSEVQTCIRPADATANCLTIMPKLRSTYDRCRIYQTSY